MDELTRITHTGATGLDGFTITTGCNVALAEDATLENARAALFERGFTPVAAVTALNAAVRIGHFALTALTAT